jgi:CheY-like chemotaxis protein/DNA-binding XRE family transcriptional regulator
LTIEEAFGIVIRRLRRERNFSQDKLSACSSLDRTFISNIEGGKQQPGLVSIFALANALGVSLSSVIFEVEFILGINTPEKAKNESENDRTDWISCMENFMHQVCDCYKGTETILLVDDEKQVRDVLSDFFLHCGYRVIIAEDGNHALEQYTKNSNDIDLVIMDVVMPKKDGISTYKEIKKKNPNAIILLMSGYNPDHLSSLEGMQILQKPFSPVEMIKKVRDALKEKSDTVQATSPIPPPS